MIEQTATALTNAMPILCGVVFPTLGGLAVLGVMEWSRPDNDVEDTYSVADYRPPATIRVRHHQQVDAPTQIIPRVLPDAGTPLYDQLSARRKAAEWLREIGQAARVNTVNTGRAS